MTSTSRKALLEKLAKLVDSDADEVAAEVYEERKRFDSKWQRDRPTIPAEMYILLGPRITPGFDMTDLATGGIDLQSRSRRPRSSSRSIRSGSTRSC